MLEILFSLLFLFLVFLFLIGIICFGALAYGDALISEIVVGNILFDVGIGRSLLAVLAVIIIEQLGLHFLALICELDRLLGDAHFFEHILLSVIGVGSRG